jgi:hypothetical protein
MSFDNKEVKNIYLMTCGTVRYGTYKIVSVVVVGSWPMRAHVLKIVSVVVVGSWPMRATPHSTRTP